MITINEIIPIKLSGITSFSISFNYNEAIVNAIKTLPNAIWHKKQCLWEIPATSLPAALDLLSKLDDIQITFLEERNQDNFVSNNITESELSQFHFTPYKHQIDGINFLLDKKKALLLDAPGCGKTLEIIGLAETLKRRGLIDHCFIVCGVASLRANWKNEIKKFSTESVLVIGEKVSKSGKVSYMSVSDRAKQLQGPISEFFIVCNIETLRSDAVIESISKSSNKFQMIAVDEIHKCLTGDSIIDTESGNLSLEELSKLATLPKVLSYNIKTGQNEFKQASNITISEPTENILELVVESNSEQHSIKCTESHKIYTTNRGWVKAKDLTFEDDIKIIS